MSVGRHQHGKLPFGRQRSNAIVGWQFQSVKGTAERDLIRSRSVASLWLIGLPGGEVIRAERASGEVQCQVE